VGISGYFEEVASASSILTVAGEGCLQLDVMRLEVLHDPEQVFLSLYADSCNAFWLDSATAGERGRFSFIGDSDGELGAVITYDVDAAAVRIQRGGRTELVQGSIFQYLDQEMRRLRGPKADLPFDFNCGFVGYFGYELKADCDGDAAHRSPASDAAFIFADRVIAFDHLERRTYLLCLSQQDDDERDPGWIGETSRRLEHLCRAGDLDWEEDSAPGGSVAFNLSRPRDQYLNEISSCKQRLFEGETYEVCLTNRIIAEVKADPLSLYRNLRRVNPAPFAAYLRFGDLAVLSSSPERFLRIDSNRWVEARPIKGTSARGESAEEDERLAQELRVDTKSRAEHVTIVDLLRNDLGIVCEFGTVHVPELMQIETYETVHQLVSGVRGRLREGLAPLEGIRACFPPGSMTGAPKKQTMEIIDELEGDARGVYSGAIGYLGLAGGCDLSVAIRAIVIDRESTSIGIGGAIVLESEPEAEYREALLKGQPSMQAILRLTRGSDAPVLQPR
jgi:para-aminobenzoate synthetase